MPVKRKRRSTKPKTPAKRVHISEPPDPDPTATIDPEFTRDPDYYLQDGDLVILVETTLFRVHRFILCRDSSTFQNMIEVCTGTDGSTDENPLQLHGDTVEAVQSLLSMLYALPDELQTKFEAFGQETGLDSLLALAEITNKYHFSSTERRLVKIFEDYVTTHKQHLRENASPEDLMRALRVAVLQNAQTVQTRLSNIFSGLVFDRSIPSHIALEFASANALRRLQGAAYYVYLMETIPQNNGTALFETTKFGQGIDGDVKIRLLHGYWSLMHTCLRLRDTPPLDLTTCESLGISEWHRTYKFPFDSSSPDLLKMLRNIKQSLRKWCDEHPNTSEARERKVLSQFSQAYQRIQDNLMDHFEPGN